MPHDQDLAVVFAKLFQGNVETINQLAADGLSRGRRALIAYRTGQVE